MTDEMKAVLTLLVIVWFLVLLRTGRTPWYWIALGLLWLDAACYAALSVLYQAVHVWWEQTNEAWQARECRGEIE